VAWQKVIEMYLILLYGSVIFDPLAVVVITRDSKGNRCLLLAGGVCVVIVPKERHS
jgi:hypothetical protein